MDRRYEAYHANIEKLRKDIGPTLKIKLQTACGCEKTLEVPEITEMPLEMKLPLVASGDVRRKFRLCGLQPDGTYLYKGGAVGGLGTATGNFPR